MSSLPSARTSRPVPSAARTLAALLFVALLPGVAPLARAEDQPAASEAKAPATESAATKAGDEALTLKEGDVLKVSFPGLPILDTTQPVRQDGRIVLPMVGEIQVTGKTTDGLNKELLALYSTKLVSKEVTVTLVASPFTIYVTGAVLRPGKITTERRITAFEAIMEAGGYDKAKSNLKAVVVIRQEGGQSRRYKLNLQQILDGKEPPNFVLKPFDSIIVPEKFTWF